MKNKKNWSWFEEKWGKMNSCPPGTGEAGYSPEFNPTVCEDHVYSFQLLKLHAITTLSTSLQAFLTTNKTLSLRFWSIVCTVFATILYSFKFCHSLDLDCFRSDGTPSLLGPLMLANRLKEKAWFNDAAQPKLIQHWLLSWQHKGDTEGVRPSSMCCPCGLAIFTTTLGIWILCTLWLRAWCSDHYHSSE